MTPQHFVHRFAKSKYIPKLLHYFLFSHTNKLHDTYIRLNGQVNCTKCFFSKNHNNYSKTSVEDYFTTEKIENKLKRQKHSNLISYLESSKIKDTLKDLNNKYEIFSSRNKLQITISEQDHSASVPLISPQNNNTKVVMEMTPSDIEGFLINILLTGLEEKEIPFYPQNSHKDILCEYLFVSKEEINTLLRKARRIYRRRESGMNPKNSKEVLLKFIEETGNLNPSSEQYAKLHEDTGLSKNQLYSFFYRQRNKLKTLSPAEKELLKEWYIENWSTPEKQETARLDHLSEHLSLSRAQLLKYLWTIDDEFNYSRKKITKNTKKMVTTFLNENPNPTTPQIKSLQESLGISKTQLYSMISRYRDPPGNVTSEAKELIYEYINKNEKIDMNVLQKITSLSRRQIHDIKRRYKNVRFSVYMRQQLEDIWSEGHRDLDTFVFRSTLSREQIRKWLWHKKKLEDFDESSLTHLDNQLYKYREEQLRMNQLWDSGCRNVSKYMHISGKSREQIRKWMWRKEKGSSSLQKFNKNSIQKSDLPPIDEKQCIEMDDNYEDFGEEELNSMNDS